MKKRSKFDSIFLVGLIPFFFIALFVVLLAIAIGYSISRDKRALPGEHSYKSEHVCPKEEKIYIHDTVFVKVPISCNKVHVQEDTKTSVQEAPNDTNKTN